MSESREKLLIDPLAPFLGYQLRRVSAEAMAQLASDLSMEGLSPALATVLLMIEANPGETQASIGRSLGIKRANIAPMIAKLEDDDLIYREFADGRSFRLYCSDRTRTVTPRLMRIMKRHEDKIFGALGEGEKTQLMRMLAALRHTE